MRTAWSAATSLGLVLVLVTACSDDPSGPGTYQGRVRSSTDLAGAVVLELSGVGIGAIEGTAGTTAFSARTSGTPGGTETFRVLLVKEAAGELNFRVDVSDLEAVAPRGIVVTAVKGDNQTIDDLASFSVQLTF